MRIAIIGRGRLARSLTPRLREAGHDLSLHGRGETPPPDADLRWLLVPDREIAGVAASLALGGPVAHASGASTLDALAPHARCGSLHPLMTFPGPDVAIPPLHTTPAAIDASDDDLASTLERIAADLTMRSFRVPGDRRLYHAAAVIAGNFGTVLLAEAARVLAAAGIDPQEAPGLLAPLALESLRNAADDPVAALTGPVVRGDHTVLDAHRRALQEAGLDALLPLYDVLVEATIKLRNA